MTQVPKSECGAAATSEASAIPVADLGSASSAAASIGDLRSVARGFASSPAAPLLVALFVCLTFLTIPRYTLIPDVESAWSAVLGYAHQKGLQFGTDIVFPYGPLGYLLVPHFLPQTDAFRLIFDFFLCFGVSAGVCLVAWRFAPGWRLLTIAVFVLVVANKPYGAQDLVLDLGFLSWGLLCLRESGRRLVTCTAILVLLCGFAVVAKITYLFSASLTIGVLAAVFWLDGKRRGAMAAAAGFLACVAGLWELAGQKLVRLPLFIERALALCSGYDQSMTLAPKSMVLAGGITVVLGAAGLVVFRCGTASQPGKHTERWRRWLATAWLSGLLFLSWKHGFVRADLHHTFLFFGFVSVFVLVVEALPMTKSGARVCSYGLAVVTCMVSLGTLQIALSPKGLSFETCFRRVLPNAFWLTHPGALRQEMERQQLAMALPGVRKLIGASSVDVFGNYQTFALMNGLNYCPRPVFQSYSAYNAPLGELNEDFYLSEHAPSYVLTTLKSIDGRFPPLEDGPLLRDLLINYDLRGAEEGFLLLKNVSHEKPKLRLISEGTVAFRQRIDLSCYGKSNLWLEVRVRPSLLGRAREFLYDLPLVRMRIWSATSTQAVQTYFAPTPMLSAGFLASPLLINDEDFLRLYANKPRARTLAFSIESSASWLWHSRIQFRIFGFDDRRAHG